MIVVFHSPVLQIPIPKYALGLGVSFFFVLSGFILAYAYPKLATTEDIRQFYVARIARIWPAHLCTLLLAMATIRVPLGQSLVNMTLPANVLLVHAWIPSSPWYFSYNAPSWSISTETFFYLLFPALIYNWGRSWWWKWLLSALLAGGMYALSIKLQLTDQSSMDEVTLHGMAHVNPLAPFSPAL